MSDLLERFLADRGALAEGELAQLVAELRADPTAAAEARALLQLDDLLSREHAADRGHFPRRVATRLATAESATFVRRMRGVRRRKRTAGTWRPLLLVAAMLAVAVGGAVLWQQRTPPVAEAVIAAGRGTGGAVRAGDVLADDVTVRWRDGTEVALGAGARLRVEAVVPKHLRLEAGRLTATVAAQPAGAAMIVSTGDAVATVVGTRLRMEVGQGTRLDVSVGQVRLAGGGGEVAVGAGAAAWCGGGSAPRLLARSLAYSFDGDEGIAVFTTARGHGWLRANDGSLLPGVVWAGGTRTRDRVTDPNGGVAVGWAGFTERWRVELPDGRYQVRVEVGGTTTEQGPHRVVAQGRTVVADVLTAPGVLHVGTAEVEVVDGRLEIDVGGTTAAPSADGSTDTILRSLRITPIE